MFKRQCLHVTFLKEGRTPTGKIKELPQKTTCLQNFKEKYQVGSFFFDKVSVFL